MNTFSWVLHQQTENDLSLWGRVRVCVFRLIYADRYPQRKKEGRTYTLEEHHGLVNVRHQESVGHKARNVLGHGRGLAHGLRELERRVQDALVRLQARDDFDEFHHRHGVHKVHADNLPSLVNYGFPKEATPHTHHDRHHQRSTPERLFSFSPTFSWNRGLYLVSLLRGSRNLGDADTARVGCQHRRRLALGIQVAENRTLDIQVLRRGLDDIVHVGQVRQLVSRRHQLTGALGMLRCDLGLAHVLVQ